MALNHPVDAPSTLKPNTDYLSLIRSHYDRVLRVGTDNYGAEHTGLWLASIDIVNGGQPRQLYPARPRVYREISSPRGSNLYWEQPALVAAYHLSQLTGDERYHQAADRYLRDFLARCVSPQNGLFLWGNHLYYDVFTDETVSFSGATHEARPLPCAWEMFWAISPGSTARAIRAMGRQHVKNHETGFFDRHASLTQTTPPHVHEDDGGNIHPFLEAGGVLVESLCWLAARQSGDVELTDLALKCARYSFRHRNEDTGLLRNQPHLKRWDYFASTTEVGLWAGCLLRAAEYSGIGEFGEMAQEAVAAWLRCGYDQQTGRYFGQLNVEDGAPAPDTQTQYAPGYYVDLWEPLFPTHNYPMPMAEACITLYQQTGDAQFKEAIIRWAGFIEQSTPANSGAGAYADQYGRCIHFLYRAAIVLNEPRWKDSAKSLADEVVSLLYSPQSGMFRSHPGEERCDAVDGIGILFLSLSYLETGHDPDGLGFHF